MEMKRVFNWIKKNKTFIFMHFMFSVVIIINILWIIKKKGEGDSIIAITSLTISIITMLWTLLKEYDDSKEKTFNNYIKKRDSLIGESEKNMTKLLSIIKTLTLLKKEIEFNIKSIKEEVYVLNNQIYNIFLNKAIDTFHINIEFTLKVQELYMMFELNINNKNNTNDINNLYKEIKNTINKEIQNYNKEFSKIEKEVIEYQNKIKECNSM